VVGLIDWLARGGPVFIPLASAHIGVNATVEKLYQVSAKTKEKQVKQQT
jgi:hypothetical protein